MPEIVEMIDPRTLALAQEQEDTAQTLLMTIEARHISTVPEYTDGVQFLTKLKGKLDELEEKRTEITKPLNESLRRINDLFRKPKEILQRAMSLWNSKLFQYREEQEQKRWDEERQARLDAQKEQDRLRQLADRKAERLEAQGKVEQAELIRESVPVIPPPIIPSDVPRVQGTAVRKNWKYRIVDPTKVTPGFLMPDETKIGKTVRALGKMAEQIVGGIEVWEEETMARTGRPTQEEK